MVHTAVAAAAAATSSSSSRQPRPPNRMRSSGSFHAGAPIPHLSSYERDPSNRRRRRLSSGLGLGRPPTHKYHTFPTPPPKTPGQIDPAFANGARAGDRDRDRDRGDSDASPDGTEHNGRDLTALPWKQLGLLALVSLAEQTALNSISPYLPRMVASFSDVPDGQEGMYVGLLASAFALAQLATNLFWGYLSDTVGRKPVMLLGTSLLGICFGFFGFCERYSQLIAVHVAMGLLNANAAIVPTCLGEVTDRSNQSRAFIWLPVMYSIGGITGPALGGLMVRGKDAAYPFLTPNIGSAILLFASVVVLAIWFDETLDGVDGKTQRAGLGWLKRLVRCRCFGRRGTGGRRAIWRPGWLVGRSRVGESADIGDERPLSSSEHPDDGEADADGEDSEDGESQSLLHSQPASDADDPSDDGGKDKSDRRSVFRKLANRATLAVLITYLFFQLSNISFNSLYPIFASAPAPNGRDLDPGTIGLSLSFAGLATILFQLFLFQPLKSKMGNLKTYRASLLGIALSMALMPWIGHLDETPLGFGTGKAWLYAELGIVLVLKNICAVGGLSSVMLLVSSTFLPATFATHSVHHRPSCLPACPS